MIEMWIAIALGVLGVVGLGLARSARASQQSSDDGGTPTTPATTSPNASSVPPSASTTAPVAKPPSGSSASDVGVYFTPPEDAELDPSGWVSTAVGEVTALPLRDRRTGLFARLRYEDAPKAAQRLGGALFTEREHDAVALEGVMLDPCTLPPDVHMSSRAWAEREDACIAEQLKAIGWDGHSPVNNAGKDWIAGAPPGKARNRGWWAKYLGRDAKGNRMFATRNGRYVGAPPPQGVLIQTTGEMHGKNHTDYSQLTRLIRREAA